MARAQKSNTPRQAQRAARLAEKEYEAVYGKPDDDGNDKPEAPAAETPAPEQEETPTPAEVVELPTAEEPPKEEPKPEVDWEQKYRTLDGKYNAEVPRLQSQNNELNSRLSDLEQRLQNAESQIPSPEEKKEMNKLLQDEEIEDYGEDMIDVVKRAAREAMMPELNALREENESLRSQLGQVEGSVAASTQDKMFNALAQAVPNWSEINRDRGFLDWLAQPDVYSGVTRQELLTKAFDSGDAPRVILFFKGFIDEQTPKQEAPAAQPEAPQGTKLDTLVAPSRPKGNTDTGGAQQSELIWTQASIAAFYADVQKGKFKNREKERASLERDIFAAMKEGRIVG